MDWIIQYFEKIWDYAVGQGPWAVVAFSMAYYWHRSSSKNDAAIQALVGEKQEVEETLRAEMNERRMEALDLQAKNHDNIEELNRMLGRIEKVMDKVIDVVQYCMAHNKEFPVPPELEDKGDKKESKETGDGN